MVTQNLKQKIPETLLPYIKKKKKMFLMQNPIQMAIAMRSA